MLEVNLSRAAVQSRGLSEDNRLLEARYPSSTLLCLCTLGSPNESWTLGKRVPFEGRGYRRFTGHIIL